VLNILKTNGKNLDEGRNENSLGRETYMKRKKRDYMLVLRPRFIAYDIPIPTAEHKFCSTRKWKFDFAWINEKVAMEIEGGLWIQGRHNRAASMINDMEKYNEAASNGWLVLRFTPQQITSSWCIGILKRTLECI
jgi:hypothetical protein